MLMVILERALHAVPQHRACATWRSFRHPLQPVHGFSGPVNVSYSRYVYPASEYFFHGLVEFEATSAPSGRAVWDPNAAKYVGPTFLPVNIDPFIQTRCTAQHAYYDPVDARENLWVSTGQQVTQLIFEDAGCTNEDASRRGPLKQPEVRAADRWSFVRYASAISPRFEAQAASSGIWQAHHRR